MEIVWEAKTGREAIDLATGVSPNIILMDIELPGLNGIETTRQILAEHPHVRIIGLSAHGSQRYVSGMLEAGASAYITKDVTAAEIYRAISAVISDKKYLSANVAHWVIDGYLSGAPKVTSSHLAPREREVLQLLAEGNTSKEISRSLHISYKTVEVHRRNIMEKLKLHSVAQLTKYAVREGITSV